MRTYFASLALLLVAACGAETVAPTTAPPTQAPGAQEQKASSTSSSPLACTAPEAAPACAAATHVASSADVIAAAKTLSWQGVALGKTGALSIGNDLVADADLELDATDITPPADCPSTQCQEPLFRTYAFPTWSETTPLPGVTCKTIGPHGVRKGDTCAVLAIAKGSTFRLRAVVEDMHPGPYSPFIELERGCNVACGETETRCAASQTCFSRGFESCAYCAGSEPAVCACAASCGDEPNGKECFVDTSPDTGVTGTCSAGRCNTK